MIALYPDIFNDVFGPLMQPGSSSHTAGPCRLGLMAYRALNDELKDIHVVLDKEGSFAGTFGHMNEDIGMLAGAYGLGPDSPEMFDIKRTLKDRGITWDFEFSGLSTSRHANAVRFILTGKSGRRITLTGNSTGGGMVELTELNGFAVRSCGETYLTFIASTLGKDELLKRTEGISCILSREFVLPEFLENSGGKTGLFITSDCPLPLAKLLEISQDVISIAPVLPVTVNTGRKEQLFDSITSFREIAKKEGKSLFDIAVEYEICATGWDRSRVISEMEHILDTMEKQAFSVYTKDTDLLETPFSGFHFREWDRYLRNRTPLTGNVTSRALKLAFGAQSQSRGVITVPGPMGNGGAYVYSVLRAISDEAGSDREDMVKALFISGIVGVIAYTRSNPTGEITGCTGECGICGAMASAGAVSLLNGTPEMTEAAASLTLQAMIGLPCDPIPGGNNQPCTSRVVSAITLAITFADLALSGRDCVVPFHEVVDVAHRVGTALPDDLKCTSRGGMCTAPSAKKIREKFEVWHKTQEGQGEA